MARSAKLTSIDAVREMAVALARFGDEMAAALDDLDINVRRSVEWIEQDRPQHWENEVRRSLDRVGEARAELEKALTYRRVGEYRPSCREERAQLEMAKHRAQRAEEIYRVLPQWAHRVDHAVRDLTGARSLLGDWLGGELPRALGVLKRMMTSLEDYTAAQKAVAMPTSSAKTSSAKPDASDDASTNSTEEKEKEQDDENMGSAHLGGQNTPGAEGSQSD